MSTALDFDTIVAHAGKLVGNETLTTFAGVWLNNIIDSLAQNHRWPELEKVATGSLAQFGGTTPIVVSLPADFGDLWDQHSLSILDTNGSHSVLTPQTWEWYDLITSPLTPGSPGHAAFNLNTQQWTPYPQPSQVYTWQLRYLLKPSRIVTGTDTIPFGTDEIFIQALFVRLLQFEDDSRYPAEYAVLQSMIHQFFGATNTSPIKSPKVRFNSNTFKGMTSYR